VERDLNLAVNYRLDVGYQLQLRLDDQSRVNRRVQQLVRKVLVDNDTSATCTIVEVHGGDSRGTLYQLTQTLADFGLSIQRAKIATEVEQLIDVFYVKTTEDGKLTEPAAVAKVRATLMQIIGAEAAEPEAADVSCHP
jgi:[protein-PII] uridylyltransferase